MTLNIQHTFILGDQILYIQGELGYAVDLEMEVAGVSQEKWLAISEGNTKLEGQKACWSVVMAWPVVEAEVLKGCEEAQLD